MLQLASLLVLPSTLQRYFPQSDLICRIRSGCTGSLVRSRMANRCGPPIPSGIVKRADTTVDSPGRRVVEPTTSFGGQHPSRTSIAKLLGSRRI